MEITMKKQKYIIIVAGIAIILFAYFSMSFLSGFKKEPKKVPEKEIFRYVKAEAVKYSTQKGEIVTSGGRVMAITSYGNTYQEAIKKSYQNIEKLHFDKMNYRKDIGFDLN